jgi:hypothetical protein
MSEDRPGRLWTTNELAVAGQVDHSVLRHLLLADKLKGSKQGRDWLIPNAEARAWLARPRRRRKPKTEEQEL